MQCNQGYTKTEKERKRILKKKKKWENQPNNEKKETKLKLAFNQSVISHHIRYSLFSLEMRLSGGGRIPLRFDDEAEIVCCEPAVDWLDIEEGGVGGVGGGAGVLNVAEVT